MSQALPAIFKVSGVTVSDVKPLEPSGMPATGAKISSVAVRVHHDVADRVLSPQLWVV
ncbi:MAG: hypothetical protein OXI96_04005 [Acidimicrobiaceae bacterium]|nr:hypothetical protein [Acidimicrobiaceae bacterium]